MSLLSSTLPLSKEKKMSGIIKAKDVGRIILEDLRAIAKKELPDATEEERELSIARFLGFWSGSMFAGPVDKS
jgi:hypothetical protein